MSNLDIYPNKLLDSISDLAIEQQIDMVMYYCRDRYYWEMFIYHPAGVEWVKANAKALNERAMEQLND